jgi:hypothetical protein
MDKRHCFRSHALELRFAGVAQRLAVPDAVPAGLAAARLMNRVADKDQPIIKRYL